MQHKRPWTAKQRAAYLNARGHYNHEKLGPVIATLRERGMTLAQISEFTGVPTGVLQNVRRYTSTIPAKGVLLAHLALELGVSAQALRGHVTAHGIPFRRYGVKVVISDRDAEQITAAYRATLTEQEAAGEDWWNIKQLAAHFSVTTEAMHMRMGHHPYNTIRARRIRGVVGSRYAYSAPDARRVSSQLPVALKTPPAGTITNRQVATLLGLNVSTVEHYAQMGAPRVQVAVGRQLHTYYRPHELAAWLSASKYPVRRSLGRTLASLTSAERAA